MSAPQPNKKIPVGVVGAGSFGVTVAQLLAINQDVLLYARDPNVVRNINASQPIHNVQLSPRILAISDYQLLADTCEVIFPVVPSDYFRAMMKQLGPLLTPRHILIHGTKGLDISKVKDLETFDGKIYKEDINTMSKVIAEESNVLRIGCLSGPNLSKEILAGQPTATVIASEFDEVVDIGVELLSSKKMFVFGSSDILGAELAGAFKNILAVGSGYLVGKGLGKNMQGLFLTRGLHEIAYFGGLMGALPQAFMGTAGIGDLIATATSDGSRNFQFGYQLGQGQTREQLLVNNEELAEGVRTLKIANLLVKTEKIRLPIIETLYKIVYEDLPFHQALDYLMRYPYARDVSFQL